MCLGIKYVDYMFMSSCIPSLFPPRSLAWCELYLIFGNIFRKLEMDIHNTRYVPARFLSLNVLVISLFFSVEDFSRFKEFFIPIHQGRQFHVFVKEGSS